MLSGPPLTLSKNSATNAVHLTEKTLNGASANIAEAIPIGAIGDSRSRQDDDEPREAEAHPPLPPMPPYPPFPPYPPMPPIIIACGCAFQHGGAWGAGHGLNPGWPVSHFAATPGPMQGPPSAQTAAPPVAQGQTASAVPAGGISFAVETSATTGRSDANGEPGPSS
jgi:hypothetical protein